MGVDKKHFVENVSEEESGSRMDSSGYNWADDSNDKVSPVALSILKEATIDFSFVLFFRVSSIQSLSDLFVLRIGQTDSYILLVYWSRVIIVWFN